MNIQQDMIADYNAAVSRRDAGLPAGHNDEAILAKGDPAEVTVTPNNVERYKDIVNGIREGNSFSKEDVAFVSAFTEAYVKVFNTVMNTFREMPKPDAISIHKWYSNLTEEEKTAHLAFLKEGK